MALVDIRGRPLVPTVRSNPRIALGVSGTSAFGGYVQTGERNPKLLGIRRYETFTEILVNASIVGACIRLFLNLIARAEWTVEPVDDSGEARAHAEMLEEWLIDDPATSWRRIVRRSAAYVFYGFSIQEWTMVKKGNVLTFKDIAPRAQKTIERWAVEDSGEVHGVWQRSPHTGQEIFLPRNRIVYLVDDSLNDSPEGLGILRHMVDPAARLKKLLKLETMGFETDLGGIPIGRAPLAALNAEVAAGKIKAVDAETSLEAMRTFLKVPVRTPDKSLILDSAVYSGEDDAASPSQTHQWGIDLLEAQSKGLDAVHTAIERTNRDLARIMGCEQLLLGGDGAGSFALSEQKAAQLFLIIDATLQEIADTYERDLVTPIWTLNGLNPDLMPELKPASPSFNDVGEIAVVLRDLATAGSTILPNDPVVRDIYGRLGLPFEERDGSEDLDESLIGREGEEPEEGEI